MEGTQNLAIIATGSSIYFLYNAINIGCQRGSKLLKLKNIGIKIADLQIRRPK
jgi:hypothetical protein